MEITDKKGKFIRSPRQLEPAMALNYEFTKIRPDDDPYIVQYVYTVPSEDDIWISAHVDVRIIG